MAEASQVKQEMRSLGPGNLQASPGDHLHDGTTSKIMNTWTTYTSSWFATGVNPSLANGTLTASYSLVGNQVNFRIVLIPGTTTTFGTGNYYFKLPFNPVSALTSWFPVGQGMLQDTSAGSKTLYFATLVSSGFNDVQLVSNTGAIWSPSSPFFLASTDVVAVSGSYERT